MKVIASFKCEECGEVWEISKDLRDVDEEKDLKCCDEYATIKRYFRGTEDTHEKDLGEMMEE